MLSQPLPHGVPSGPGSSALLTRAAIALGVLLASGLLAAMLVRMAPGFGMDERLMDARLNRDSLQAIEHRQDESSNVARYYWNYLLRLAHGDLGVSLSLGRPVRELLSERLAVSAQSGLGGLLLAWIGAGFTVLALELGRRRLPETVAAITSGALLCVPGAVVAVACVYIGAAPAVAIAIILFPRIFRYLRGVARQACEAPHVLAVHALGLHPLRILTHHVIVPIAPELLALAGVSVSMAVGATIPVEALCGSPGVGQLVWESALARDLPVLVNLTLLITAVTVVANLMADTARSMREAEA